jgi:hypothetical protein
MKYEKEIDQLLRDVFYEDWMEAEEYDEIIYLLFTARGISKQNLSNAIEVGIENGYPLETQLKLGVSVFKT